MDRAYEKRLQLIVQLLDAKSQTSATMTQYHALWTEQSAQDAPTIREIHFILAVEPGTGKTMSELAEKLGVTQGAVSQTAALLEGKGLILRRKNPDNLRQVIAALTEKGVQAYQMHTVMDRDVHTRFDARFLKDYSDEQLQFLLEYERWMNEVFLGIVEKRKKRKKETAGQ